MATRTIANAGGNWNATGAWVEGAVPTAADDVVATATSGNLTINVSSVCRSINLTNYVGTLTQNTNCTLTIGTSSAGAGSIALKFVAGMTYTTNSGATLLFTSTAATQQTIDFAGKATRGVIYNGAGGSWKLLSAHTQGVASQLILTAGALDTNGQACTWGLFSSIGSIARSLTAGASTITLAGVDGTTKIWDFTGGSTNFTPSLASSTIVISDVSSSVKTFDGKSLVYGALTITGVGTGTVTILGSNTFSTVTIGAPKTVIFLAGGTSTMTNFVATGSAGNVITIRSDAAGVQHTFSEAPALVSCNWLSLKDINATGGASWYAGANSTNVSGNTGWTFSAPIQTPIPITGIARGVTSTAASLRGTLDASGAATTYYFQYGPTTGYGTNVPVGQNGAGGSGFGPNAVSQSISGLTPNTTYHYRLVATNSFGTVNGADATLLTDPTPNANQRIVIDATTERSVAVGGTSDSFTHTPVGSPQAVVVLVASRNVAANPVTAVTYGGLPMARREYAGSVTSPFPSVQIWFLDDVPNGAQTVAITKVTGAALEVVVTTLLALGAVVIDSSNSTSGSQKTQTVSLAPSGAGGAGLAFGITSSASDVPPYYRSDALLSSGDEGTEVYDAQYTPVLRAGLAVGLVTVFTTNETAAYGGVLLLDPNPGPTATEDEVDFETGDLSQASFIQALPGRITVVSSPVVEGTRSGRFEIQQDDDEPSTGLDLCQLQTGISLVEGTENYFRYVSRVESWDFNNWGNTWEIHGANTRLGVYLGDGVGSQEFRLQNGVGAPIWWIAPFIGLGQWFEIVIHMVHSQTAGVIEVWLNGVKQTLTNNQQIITGANTLMGGPPNDNRIGIYRSQASTGTSVVYYDDYRVMDAFFSDPPPGSGAAAVDGSVLGLIWDLPAGVGAARSFRWDIASGSARPLPTIDLPTTLAVAPRVTTLKVAPRSTSLKVAPRRTTVTFD